MVYDASARENVKHPSLNDCLHPGPSLQNILWNILIRSRFHPILLTGDLQKAFLQIRIKEEERDSLRFHWRAPGSTETRIYRFTRALFGLTSSPFLLAGVLNQHLELWERQYPEIVKRRFFRKSRFFANTAQNLATKPSRKNALPSSFVLKVFQKYLRRKTEFYWIFDYARRQNIAKYKEG